MNARMVSVVEIDHIKKNTKVNLSESNESDYNAAISSSEESHP